MNISSGIFKGLHTYAYNEEYTQRDNLYLYAEYHTKSILYLYRFDVRFG